jgi:hypothetical protein
MFGTLIRTGAQEDSVRSDGVCLHEENTLDRDMMEDLRSVYLPPLRFRRLQPSLVLLQNPEDLLLCREHGDFGILVWPSFHW